MVASIMARSQVSVPPARSAVTARSKPSSARRPRVEKVAAYGRRGNSGKVLGPVGAAIRDALMPSMFRLLMRNGDPQAWILDHRLDPLPAR